MHFMKNLINPQTLVELRREPISFERIASVLESNTEITASQLCKLLSVEPQQFYSWKCRHSKQRRIAKDVSDEADIVPTGAKKKIYSAQDKLRIVKRFMTLTGGDRTELLRKFGLYESDLARWREKADEAALAALGTRKIRSDKKSSEQIEIERLKGELRGQEKTIAKLSAIVVAQKKISEFLAKENCD